MPDAKRYWKNPAKHRKEVSARYHKLHDAGLTRQHQLSPAAAARYLAAKRKWCQTHRAANNKAVKKYNKKLQAAVGGTSLYHKWRYRLLKESL
mgnify:CR=1 FL=1